MHEEHCLKGSFDFQFNTGNPYNIITQPHLEWKYVVSDEHNQRLPCPPLHSEADVSGIPATRDIKCPRALLQLDLAQQAGLSFEEVIAVILYSGPMFVVYNCILRRHSQPPNLYQHLVSSRNLFPTTIVVLCSALQKLSRYTRIPNGTPLFRGLGGYGKFTLELPDSFYACDDNGCSGYLDYGFQSWTADVATGLRYSGVFQGKPGACMLETQSSSIDRGADITQFSQFPGEKEFTFVPCCFVQGSGGHRDQLVQEEHQLGYVSVVPVRINVNLKIETIEDLLEKKKARHLTSFQMLCEETRTKLFAFMQNAGVQDADARPLIDHTMKQVDDIIMQHQDFSRNEYADDLKYSQLVSQMMRALRWSKEKLFLWLETARDRCDDNFHTQSLADSHRMWQAFLQRKFAGATWGTIERKKTAIQLLQSRELLNSDAADDAVDSASLVRRAATEIWSDSDVEYLVAATDVRMQAGWTPAMAAAANGHADILQGLLSLCDINECDRFGVFALFLASCFGQTSCVEIVLQHPTAHVQKLNSLGFSSLDIAYANGHWDCVYLLKQHLFQHAQCSMDLDLRAAELSNIALQLLQHFVLKSDVKGLTEIIKKGVSVNASDPCGQSVLNFASLHGASAAVEVLIAFGANVNKCDRGGTSPLRNAQKGGHVACIAVLEAAGAALSVLELAATGDAVAIEKSVGLGADIHMLDTDGLGVMHYAALHGHASCIANLATLGADVNARATNHCSVSISSRYSPLHCAALRADVGCIEVLAKLGADMNICNINGQSAIHSAYTGHKTHKSADLLLQCIDALTRFGTDVNIRGKRGWTALYDPTCVRFVPQMSPEAEQDFLDISLDQRVCCSSICVRLLLDRNADANLCDGTGKSPLQRAREHRFADVEAVLLTSGAQVSIFDAVRTGDLCIVKNLVLNGAGGRSELLVSTALCSCWTPLDVALTHNHAEVAAFLEEAGAKPSIISAAAAGNACAIDALISRVDVDAVGNDGNSALHTAVIRCHESSHHAVIHALARAGANVNSRNLLGQTPLFLAIGHQKAATQDLLRGLGAKLTVFEAASCGDVAAIEQFALEGGDINMHDESSKRSNTALHEASRCGKLNCVLSLLKMKADVNTSDSDGRSPLQWASDGLVRAQELALNPKSPHCRESSDVISSGVYESIIQSLKAAGASLSIQQKKQLSAHTVTHVTAVEVMRYHGSVTMTRRRGGGCVSPDYSLQFDNFNTFVADVELCDGCFYFEIHILRGHVSQFGFCSKGFEASEDPEGQGVGDDDKSWAVDGHRKQKWHNNEGMHFGSSWSNNDVIGLAIDMRHPGAAVMSVSVNGSFDPPNGVAFERISAPYLSPALTASGHIPPHPSLPEWNVISNIPVRNDLSIRPGQYRVNFGERAFKFDPPRGAGYMSVYTFHMLQQRR
jgi:ankyrin repeat protein